jgi:hypothetical protein
MGQVNGMGQYKNSLCCKKPFTKFLLLFFFASDQKNTPPYIFFSGEIKFSGTAAGDGTTVPEFRNSTKSKSLYIFKHPFPSSIQTPNQKSQITNTKA